MLHDGGQVHEGRVQLPPQGLQHRGLALALAVVGEQVEAARVHLVQDAQKDLLVELVGEGGESCASTGTMPQ